MLLRYFSNLQCTTLGGRQVAATWSELGKVHVWDLSRPLNACDDSVVMATYTRNQESPEPVYTFTGHQTEGFALDWSCVTPGKTGVSVTPQALVEVKNSNLGFRLSTFPWFTLKCIEVFIKSGIPSQNLGRTESL